MEHPAALALTSLTVGYFVLAGCDVGLGMLMPHLARTAGDRRRLVAAIAPYFLGTEVWLVATVGMMVGLFPEVESRLPAAVVLLVLLPGWLSRDAGLWLRSRSRTAAWRHACDTAVVVGSWALAVGLGLVLADLLTGGRPGPATVFYTLTTVLLLALRGAAFGAERLVPPEHAAGRAESADAAARLTRTLARGGVVATALATGAAFLPGAGPERLLPAAAGAAVLVAVLAVASGLSGPRWSGTTSALAVAIPPLVTALSAGLPTPAAPPQTLALVGTTLLPLVPVMAVGQIWLYRLSRRPASTPGFFA
ncbi:cytochrome bd-type quinol oxidase subunit 2 [Haloactinospora alba]|uniref:Cytochrome bd-type quinol oxidase subunit 2 n=1 Tax=Haloactinospora alba TaxID=405555 RepID=A0A543NKX4_9ACTN|nr:cytochrome d ubiquinol oxidase subunit II [Haloactinospora alba]TQN32456.1 cytochrome bd-type quinol oxidase subunit 2 [Haloactinospora alba]